MPSETTTATNTTTATFVASSIIEKDWRETRPIHQLHLSDEVRLRMGKAAISYFCALYGIEA